MTAGTLPINYDDPNLYEHLNLIINQFEKAALRSGSRQAYIATAQAPLEAMDMILASSDSALGMGRTAHASRAGNSVQTSLEVESVPEDFGSSQAKSHSVDEDDRVLAVTDSRTPGVNTRGLGDGELGNGEINIKPPKFEVGSTGSVGFDADINDLFGGEGDPNKRGDTFGDYLSECLGCDLRLTFDWQLQPIDLLLPIANLLADINGILDQFEGFLDPFGYLNELCDFLNGLRVFCIADLILILMALKMLLKSYLTFQLNLKLDWTVLLGPLLKLILDALSTLLQEIAGIVVAPLDCAYAALTTVADLQDELAETVALAAATGARLADRATLGGPDDELNDFETSSATRWNNVRHDNETVNAKNDKFDVNIPSLKSFTTVGGPADGAVHSDAKIYNEGLETGKDFSRNKQISFPQGFQLDANTTLPEALKIPEFLQTNPFRKLALSVRDAKNYIMDLVRKILFALNALQGLVGGSLTLNLSNLGLVLFVKDMINLVLLVIKMLRQHPNVSDWCSHLQENPAILERELNNTRVQPARESLILISGDEQVGEVRTCLNDRSSSHSALLAQWITELKRDGNV